MSGVETSEIMGRTVTGITSVLLTTSTFPRSREDPVTARFVLDLARHLARHVRVAVLAPAVPGGPAREQWDDVTVVRHRYFIPDKAQVLTGGEGILATMRDVPLARLQLPCLMASQWQALPRVVRAEQADVVNAHWIVPQGLLSALWRNRLSFAHVLTAHAADVAYLRRTAFGPRLARFIVGRSDRSLPVSSHLARQIEELVGGSVPHSVIPMGVSAARFHPAAEPAPLRSSPEERIVLWVGKLVAKKGVGTLLEALAELRGRGCDVRGVLVGGGPLEGPIRRRTRELGLEDGVDLLGWRKNEDLPSLYAAADVVCVPSVEDERGETEGMPVVVQEALAAGRIVVASRISGIPDVLRHGENGWLTPPGEAGPLANTLRRALEMDEADRRSMSRAARATAMAHTWDRVAERYMEEFQRAAEEAPTP